MSSRVAARAWTLWGALVAAAMAVVAGAHLVVLVRYFAFPYGDLGWTIEHIVYNAWQLVHGPPLYVDPVAGEPTAFHYPPGLTLLIAPFAALFGPELWTGRLVNALATVLSIVLVTRETARRVRDRRLAWFAPGLVFLLASASFSSLLWVHPENWAVAWSLLALVLAGRTEAAGRGAVWAALASFAAVATKQTMLIHVPAAALVLALRRPRAALVYLATGAALLLAGSLLGQALTGGRFLDYVLLSQSFPLAWSKLPGILGYLGWYLAPALLLWLAGLRYGEPRPGLRGLLRDPFAVALALSLPALSGVLV
ncbi:MAG TPA: glycosyltransferase 87 family protein, partial [Planctomycetota bacterium]|nr:glycosyltransferase 87 family protein [Planctomycetota bacterium]